MESGKSNEDAGAGNSYQTKTIDFKQQNIKCELLSRWKKKPRNDRNYKLPPWKFAI